MFKRQRRRATSNPAPSNPPNASASLAATKAFLQDRQSNGALSSAAAAAALRTHPSSPTAVGETVTKRMVRKSSVSSHGSGSQQGPGLRRQNSSGSMTERSFRSPSPAGHSPIDPDAPPVPAVPKHVTGVAPVHRRASSLEPPNRGGSPAGRGGGRGVSVDSGARAPAGPGKRVMSLPQVPEYEQDGRPQSVNFSRPISPAIATSPSKPAQGGWFAGPVVNADQTFRGGPTIRPKTSDGTLQHDAQNAWQSVQNAADRSVSTRRGQMSQGVEGARLASGSMRAKPSGSGVRVRQGKTAVDPKSADAVYDPSTRSFIRKQDAMARFRQLHEEEEAIEPHHAQYVPPQRPQSQPPRRLAQHTPADFEPVQEHVHSQPRPQSQPPRPLAEPFEPVQHHPLDQPVPQRSPIPLQDAHEPFSSPSHEHERHYETEQVPPAHVQHRIDEEVEPAISPSLSHSAAMLNRITSEDLAEPDIRPSTVPNSAQQPLNIDINVASQKGSDYIRSGTLSDQTTSDLKVGRGRGSIRTDRGSSLSPPRNAHFATGSLELPNGALHQPPPRSVSPAKSALKASPSGSRRNSSPLANSGRLVSKAPQSEASDNVSEDGAGKKKKIRVSFEEAPVIAGTSAYSESEAPSSPTGLSLSKWSTSVPDDLGDVMKPRPALPSFGSVRGKGRRASEDDAAEKVTETVSSSMTASVGSIKGPYEASSDHALGNVVSQDFASKKQTTALDPIPPEVTSVEGSGYYSDSSSSNTAFNDSLQHSRVTEPETSAPEPKSLTRPVEDKPSVAPTPFIAIQPATPNLLDKSEDHFSSLMSEKPMEQKDLYSSQRPYIPGGWDEDEEPQRQEEVTRNQSTEKPAAPTHISFAEQLPPPSSRDQESESSDNDSIYSDAYEELTDTDEGGFASIDKIVESSIAPPTSGLLQSKHAGTGAVDVTESPRQTGRLTINEAPSAPSHDRDGGKGPNSLVGAVTDEQQYVLARTVTATEPTIEPPRVVDKPRPVRKARVQSAPKVPKASPVSQPTQQAAQPRKSALKKHAAAVPATSPEPHMRTTMRGSPAPREAPSSDTHMRKTMRSSGPGTGVAPGLAASRHSVTPAESRPAKAALQKKHLPATGTAPRATLQTAASRVATKPSAVAPSYDSDSDASVSSFQKERQRNRASRGMNGAISMRRSMRTDPAPTMRSTSAVRPMTPPNKLSTSAAPAFRRSLRPSSPVSEAPKSSRFSLRSLSPTGKFRSPLSKPSKAKAPAKNTKSSFGSRFDDSSDEEYEDRSRRFQSRFPDSDDDDDFELPTGLAPVRGIPKRPGEEDGDSTDLEDEDSDAERPSTAKDLEKGQSSLTNGNTTGLQKSKHAPARPAFDSGKKAKGKRGFFGLGKKKAAAAEPTAPEPGTQPAESPDIPMPPAHRERETNQALTPIVEDIALEDAPTPRSPKLQRRLTPQWGRSASDSWPLPSPPVIGGEARPQSSDGVHFAQRPGLSKRFSSQASHAPSAKTTIDPKSGKEVVVGRTGKKKKFQGLRRVFGLND